MLQFFNFLCELASPSNIDSWTQFPLVFFPLTDWNVPFLEHACSSKRVRKWKLRFCWIYLLFQWLSLRYSFPFKKAYNDVCLKVLDNWQLWFTFVSLFLKIPFQSTNGALHKLLIKKFHLNALKICSYENIEVRNRPCFIAQLLLSRTIHSLTRPGAK